LDKINELFDRAIVDVKEKGKKLLISDLSILEDRIDDIDLVIQMSEKTFAARSEQRNEPYDSGRMLWKEGIDDAMRSVPADKLVTTDKYFSDLYTKRIRNNIKKPESIVYTKDKQAELLDKDIAALIWYQRTKEGEEPEEIR